MKRYKGFLFLIVVFFVWFALAGGLDLYVDSLWFDSVGYSQVFSTILGSRFAFWLAGFLISFAVLGFNFFLASRRSRRSSGRYWVKQEWVYMFREKTDTLLWLIVVGVSVFIGLVIQTQWTMFLKYYYQAPAQASDPVFGRNISFYFFSLPALEFAVYYGMALIALGIIIGALTYLIHGHLGYVGNKLQFTTGARVHLSILVGIGFLMAGVHFWLKRFELLFNQQKSFFGAGYADLHAWLPAYWILVGLCVITGVLFFLSTITKTLRFVIVTSVGFLIVYLLTNVYPSVIQTFVVEPNELEKESPYIAYNIQGTLEAYNLDKVEVRDFTPKDQLDTKGLEQNRATLRNIRLWDWRPLKDAYEQLQSIRPYYEFTDVDLDRYVINGNYRQVMISARELNFNRIPEQARTWINQYFQYTHGYGVCMSPVNEVTEEGLPEFFVNDIPPRSGAGIKITRPEIYFGEETNYPVFVRTTMKEFDYPMGDQNAFTTYEADRGLAISGFFRRLLFAWQLRSFQILFTQNFTPESRVLLYRNVAERVSKIAPFLTYEDDPYITVVDGKLYWMLDAYTLTRLYPYSEPFQGKFNYIRNSVKVTIDAYTGDVHFYVADPHDPIINVYQRIFPGVFKPLSEMPAGLRSHVRYPDGLFNIQRQMYRTYHMRDPRVFYNKEDLWEIPTEIYRDNEQVMESYYMIMSLPESKKEEFLLLIPFTPKNKNNMIAWMAALSDGDNYGRLVLYQFPKQELTYGPMQIEARIDQDPNISQLITLWSQKGSQVIRGNLLVIPVNNSLLYVEPLYLQAEKSKIPELTRIIASYGNRVVLEETLQAALEKVVGATALADIAPTAPEAEGPLDAASPAAGKQDLLRQAVQYYEAGQKALKQGDWATYGEEQRKLGEVLRQLAGGGQGQ